MGLSVTKKVSLGVIAFTLPVGFVLGGLSEVFEAATGAPHELMVTSAKVSPSRSHYTVTDDRGKSYKVAFFPHAHKEKGAPAGNVFAPDDKGQLTLAGLTREGKANQDLYSFAELGGKSRCYVVQKGYLTTGWEKVARNIGFWKPDASDVAVRIIGTCFSPSSPAPLGR